MKDGLKAGDRAIVRFVVDENMAAAFEGRKIVCEISAVNSAGRTCAGTQTQSPIKMGELDGK